MPKVAFTPALKRFFPELKKTEVHANSVAEIVHQLNGLYPGLQDYIVDEHGRLRKHVNIFVADSLIEDKETLQDEVKANDEVFIMQALSGG